MPCTLLDNLGTPICRGSVRLEPGQVGRMRIRIWEHPTKMIAQQQATLLPAADPPYRVHIACYSEREIIFYFLSKVGNN
jgi:hypothetical protein